MPTFAQEFIDNLPEPEKTGSGDTKNFKSNSEDSSTSGTESSSTLSETRIVQSPESALNDLMEQVDDICDWLDYYPKLEDLERSLKSLNAARLRHLVARSRARNDSIS